MLLNSGGVLALGRVKLLLGSCHNLLAELLGLENCTWVTGKR